MSGRPQEKDAFDLKLAVECANAYADSTGLGCTVSDVDGAILHSAGYSCHSCKICRAAGKDPAGCIQAHIYGMTEAERFGGKYIYFCPMGLTCFVSPILGDMGSAAKITVGPFLMVDLEDYTAFELQQSLKLSPKRIDALLPYLEEIPHVSPGTVNSMSVMLFMAVGFLNKVSVTNRMLESQESDSIQGQIGQYILELKSGGELPRYPLETEREMLAAIGSSDKPKAQRLLNELLGHILFLSGGDFARIKTRIYELLVMISRATVDAGASPEQAFQMTHDFFRATKNVGNIDDLCFMLAAVMNKFIDSVFAFSDLKNADVIRKAVQYVQREYARKITLDDVAAMVHLSPAYFSKMFKKEMNTGFNAYLNSVRIEKSKQLLLREDISLAEIAGLVGFEDQSYFTKVFKKITGVSPNQFRKRAGQIGRSRQE